MQTTKAFIVINDQIAEDIFKMILLFSEGFETPCPGQFINIAIPDVSMLLRRPISISDVSEIDRTVTIIYQVRGKGTKLLSEMKTGQPLDVLYFLGNGFKLGNSKKVLLIGGGIGAAPLLYCAKRWRKEAKFDTILGFRSGKTAYYLEEFSKACGVSLLATEDGSLGKKGYVTDVLKEYILNNKPDLIMSCGPAAMFKALQKEAAIPCQMSLEERMGCGMGACMVCSCKIKSNGDFDYLRVCADGPVFDAREVEFE